eukprot:14912091-Ditylum_brightwellii.AAC.1
MDNTDLDAIMKKMEDLMKKNEEIEAWQDWFDERLKQKLKKQEEVVKNQLDSYNEKNMNNFTLQETKMDYKFKKMEALLNSIQEKLESNNK